MSDSGVTRKTASLRQERAMNNGAQRHGTVHRVAPAEDLVRHAEFAQRGDGVAGKVERKAELAGVVRTLEDPRAPAAALERHAGSEAADAGPDDERGVRDAFDYCVAATAARRVKRMSHTRSWTTLNSSA